MKTFKRLLMLFAIAAALAIPAALAATGDSAGDFVYFDRVNQAVKISSAAVVNFFSSADTSGGSADVGLKRSAAGVIAVTNGTSGNGGLQAATLAVPTGGGAVGQIIAASDQPLAMSANGLISRLGGTMFCQTANLAQSSFTTRTTAIGTGVGTLTLPANYLTVGKWVRLRLGGIYSAQATAGNVTLDFSVAGVAVSTSTTGTVWGTAAETSQAWWAEVDLVCITTGASGTAFSAGQAHFAMSTFVDQTCGITAATTFVIDTTATKALNFNITLGTSSATNTLNTQYCFLEAMN